MDIAKQNKIANSYYVPRSVAFILFRRWSKSSNLKIKITAITNNPVLVPKNKQTPKNIQNFEKTSQTQKSL
jgi:hypothetical protein